MDSNVISQALSTHRIPLQSVRSSYRGTARPSKTVDLQSKVYGSHQHWSAEPQMPYIEIVVVVEVVVLRLAAAVADNSNRIAEAAEPGTLAAPVVAAEPSTVVGTVAPPPLVVEPLNLRVAFCSNPSGTLCVDDVRKGDKRDNEWREIFV